MGLAPVNPENVPGYVPRLKFPVTHQQQGERAERIIRPQVGDILAGIFRELGVENCIPGGGCQSTRGRMNAAGIRGCKDHRQEFIDEIKSRAAAIPLSAWMKAGAMAIVTGLVFVVNPIDPIPGLFDEAIRRAENQ